MERLMRVFSSLVLFPQVELESSLQDAQYRQQQLELTNSNLQRCLERLTEEKEEREREAVSCFNTLEVKAHPPQERSSCLRCRKAEILSVNEKLSTVEKQTCFGV